jgi:hypothetical protein
MIVQARTKLADRDAELLVGKHPTPEMFPFVLRGAGKVYKPNGDLLLAVIPNAISEQSKADALPFLLRAAKRETTNRGLFAGGERTRRVKSDGTLSATTQGAAIRSSVAGFMDRYPRIPYCRPCAMTEQYPDEWPGVYGACVDVARAYRSVAPARFAAQSTVASNTHPAYVIPGTPFTTLTINGTTHGANHRDAGDLPEGFGCISVFRSGDYRGGLLGFPAYGVAADLNDRDVIVFDPHEIHGNTAYEADGEPHVDYMRLSVVYYYRTKISDCLSPADELARVKSDRGVLPHSEESYATD